MKNRILAMIALMLVLVMSLSSCGVIDWVKGFFNRNFGEVIELTDAPLNAERVVDFAEPVDPTVLFESDGWSNGDVFNVVWKKHNVHYENGIMRLGITEEKATAWINDAEVEYNYTAGEARTQNYYHYGDYEVSMKPSANMGTASTFFICTGPYDLKDGVPNPHDEIDIEFLGKDTTHVQFNFFVDGVGGNEYMYDLGFDASEEFHTYGFRWEPNAITWFVDGEPVYKVTTDKDVQEGKNVRIVEKLPSTAGRMLANYWCGNERAWGWMSAYHGPLKDQGTEYKWIATSAEGAPLNPPAEPPVGDEVEIDWTTIDPIAPTFETTPEYTVAIDGNKTDVTYTDVGGQTYKPIEMDVSELVADKNLVHLIVTNNGTETVNVRVNMYDPTLTGNNTATNISATMNGEPVRTDLEWGGSFFDIPAGETAELVVQFGAGATKLQLMIDSSRSDADPHSGSITVEDIKFAKHGDIVTPDPNPNPDEGGEEVGAPESGDCTMLIDGVEVTFGGNKEVYGINVNDENNTVNIAYNKVSTNTWLNVQANVAEPAAGKTNISFVATNNGTEPMMLSVKLEKGAGVEVAMQKYEIAAGESLNISIDYADVVETLVLFLDTDWTEVTTTHAGNVTLSEIHFGGEVVPEPDPVAPIVNISNLAEGTTEGGELIEGTGISAAVGLAIDANGKEIDGFTFSLRLKLGGTMTASSKYVKIVTNDAATIVVYGMASSKDATGRTLQICSLADGALSKLAETAEVGGAAIAKYELSVDAAGEYYLGSTNSGINLYYIAVVYAEQGGDEPSDPPAQEELVLNFWASNTDMYTTNGNNIKYSGAGNTYTCVGSADIVSLATGNDTFTVTITNNGAADSRVRVDIQGTTIVGNHAVLNTAAVGGDVWTDFDWGGSTVTVPATQSVTLVITYDENTDRGAVENLVLFVDSGRGDSETYNSDVTLSGMSFSKVGTSEPEDPKPEEPQPVEGEYLSFTGNDCYTRSATSEEYVNTLRVTYTDVSDNTYQNINTWIKDKAEGKTTLGVTVKNNGSETVTITVKLEAAGAVGLIEGKMVIEAGKTQTISLEFAGEAELLYFFIDSGWAETTATHAGDITISGINFK